MGMLYAEYTIDASGPIEVPCNEVTTQHKSNNEHYYFAMQMDTGYKLINWDSVLMTVHINNNYFER